MAQTPDHQNFIPISHLAWELGENEWHTIAKNDDYEPVHPMHVVRAAWSLMQQTIHSRTPFEIEKGQTDRPARRRMKRLNLPDQFLVVRLRRLNKPDRPEQTTSPDWSHRWLVNGHWRNQYLPSLNCHRLQWISPYVKGPEHRPLVLKDRITAWIR